MKRAGIKKFTGLLLGLTVTVNGGTVFAQSNDNILDGVTISINDEVLEEKGLFYQGKYYVPVEEIAEKTGMTVETDEEKNAVSIRELWYDYWSGWEYNYEEIDPAVFELSKDGVYIEFPEVPSFENTIAAEFTGGVVYNAGDHVYRYTVENAPGAYEAYLSLLEEAGFQSKGFYTLYTSSILLIKGDIELELAYEIQDGLHEIWIYIERMDVSEIKAYPTKRFYDEWKEIPSFSYFKGIPTENENRIQTVDGKCFYTYEYADFSYYDFLSYISYVEELGFEFIEIDDYTFVYVKGETVLRMTVEETELSITGHNIEQEDFINL